MMIQTLELELLNHLFYYSEVSGGNIAGTATAPFLGDLALTYALRAARHDAPEQSGFRDRPHYEEMRTWGYYCTVGQCVLPYARTGSYLQATQFHHDGYYDAESLHQSAGHTFKNIRRVQGIQAGTRFRALLMTARPLEVPPVIRVGTTRQTLVKVGVHNRLPDTCTLNAFTARTVFQNLPPLLEVLQQEEKIHFQYVVEAYYLMQQVPVAAIKPVFEPLFSLA